MVMFLGPATCSSKAQLTAPSFSHSELVHATPPTEMFTALLTKPKFLPLTMISSPRALGWFGMMLSTTGASYDKVAFSCSAEERLATRTWTGRSTPMPMGAMH